jgi:hypothetical protein
MSQQKRMSLPEQVRQQMDVWQEEGQEQQRQQQI